MKLSFALFASCALLISVPAHAAEITENAVRSFSNQMNEAHKKPYDQYVALIDTAFTDDSTFVIQDKLSIPGQPVKETDQNLTKPQYMADLKSGYDTLQGAKIKYQIVDIKIGDDKKSAVLTDQTYVQNKIPTPGETKGQKMDFTSTALCRTNLILTSANKMQAKKTICNSQTNVVLPPGLLGQ